MKNLMTGICLVFMAFSVQVHSFTSSQEEEIEEDLQYWHKMYPQRTKEDLHDELKTLFVSNMYQVESIDNFIARIENSDNQDVVNVVEQMRNVKDIFNDLKVKMQIPDEVDLWFIHNPVIVQKDQSIQIIGIKEEEALYDGHDRRVYITANFMGRVPATRLYQLLHELTHVQQHQRLGLRKLKEFSSYDQEHEADTNAIAAIKCPICIQLIADEWSLNDKRADFGYLSKKSVEQSKKTKIDEDICKAHNVDTQAAEKLRDLMPVQEKQDWWKSWFGNFAHEKEALDRLNLDWQCSQKAEDRLSTVRFEK